MSAETAAPLDPLIWVEGALRSTYPACMAVKAAAEQATTADTATCAGCARGSCASAASSTTSRRWSRRPRRRPRRRALPDRPALARDHRGVRRRPRARPRRWPRSRASGAPRSSRGAGGAPLPTLVFAGEDGPRDASRARSRSTPAARAAEAAARRPAIARPASEEVDRAASAGSRRAEVEVLCDLPGPARARRALPARRASGSCGRCGVSPASCGRRPDGAAVGRLARSVGEARRPSPARRPASGNRDRRRPRR